MLTAHQRLALSRAGVDFLGIECGRIASFRLGDVEAQWDRRWRGWYQPADQAKRDPEGWKRVRDAVLGAGVDPAAFDWEGS